MADTSKDALAHAYDLLYAEQGYHNDETYSHTVKELKKLDKRGLRGPALDVGCSIGNTLKYWENRKVEAYGVDIAQAAVDRCIKRGLSAKQGFAEAIPYEDGRFATVTCTDVLEHLPEERMEAAVGELARVMAPGALLVAKPCPRAERNTKPRDWLREEKGIDLPGLHLTVRSIEWYCALIRKAGLTIEKVDDCVILATKPRK